MDGVMLVTYRSIALGSFHFMHPLPYRVLYSHRACCSSNYVTAYASLVKGTLPQLPVSAISGIVAAFIRSLYGATRVFTEVSRFSDTGLATVLVYPKLNRCFLQAPGSRLVLLGNCQPGFVDLADVLPYVAGEQLPAHSQLMCCCTAAHVSPEYKRTDMTMH